MADVQEVYGVNYNIEACYERLNYSAKILASNLAHHSFNIKHDSGYMWDGNNMRIKAIKLMIDKAQNMNPKLIINHIPKTSQLINMFPYLIDGAVEYFRIIDKNSNKIYLIYITPFNLQAY